MTQISLTEAFDILKDKFKTHGAVANALHLSRDHYRKLRNGHVSIPPSRVEYILLKAREVSDPPTAAHEREEA